MSKSEIRRWEKMYPELVAQVRLDWERENRLVLQQEYYLEGYNQGFKDGKNDSR
jgi:uncharacterized protein YecA (UPF0149 family)